jgi:hypothetical protein
MAGAESMMGSRQVEHGALFYNFSIDAHVPVDHLLRSIDRFVDLSELRGDLAPFYSSMGLLARRDGHRAPHAPSR